MSIVISDEIIRASELSQAEFLQEIALHLFQSGRLTLGYAAQMAEMEKPAFQEFLKSRQVPLYVYDVEDFEVDLKNLRELNRL
ncbi:UPF0175 family protein [Leptolyngbya cf. ectocarpi LEGE 11479]|uniref:UPF0175 family protein n=1 Tax=Leptolyngbya cf. ectocarpi LEGE 11479 TaxID=1828722 RepID=A0A929FAD2_LEPEC|nr:UPF0175 family protein [Leptolyngbya ectocarpi]MBE9070340.1 UPF0175 family protein [Leptolyngbya cf. ectocarpi LEGE 11479]